MSSKLFFNSYVIKGSAIGKAIQIHPIPYSWYSAVTAELPDVIVRFAWQYWLMVVTGYPKIIAVKLRAEIVLEIAFTTVDDGSVPIVGLAELAECLQRELYLISPHALGSVILHIDHRQEVMLWPLFIRCPLDDVR